MRAALENLLAASVRSEILTPRTSGHAGAMVQHNFVDGIIQMTDASQTDAPPAWKPHSAPASGMPIDAKLHHEIGRQTGAAGAVSRGAA